MPTKTRPSYFATPNIDFACMGFRQTADPDDGVMRFHQPYAKYADILGAEMPTDLLSMIDRTVLDYEGEI
jgi:hypothetical protein